MMPVVKLEVVDELSLNMETLSQEAILGKFVYSAFFLILCSKFGR
jgi:hypothetical protein